MTKTLQVLKDMANDPNSLKRGIHRIGIAIGTLLVLIVLCFFLFVLALFCYYTLWEGQAIDADILKGIFFFPAFLIAFGIPVALA